MVVGQLNKFLFILLLIFFYNNNLFALEFKGKFEQGSFIIGKTNPKHKVMIDNKRIKVTKDGYFAFGLGRDRKTNVLIKLINENETKIVEKKVFKRDYKIQKIDGLPEKKVTPPKEVYDRIKRENKLIGEARAIESNLTFFKDKLPDDHKDDPVTMNINEVVKFIPAKIIQIADAVKPSVIGDDWNTSIDDEIPF